MSESITTDAVCVGVCMRRITMTRRQREDFIDIDRNPLGVCARIRAGQRKRLENFDCKQ